MRRSSGVLLHITSLPGRYGIGTLGKQARQFADFCRQAGLSWWQVLPVGPTGYGNSPYQSDSVFAGNPQLIDLEELTALPIGIEGVKIGLTFRQQPGGSWRVSIRTAKGVDAVAVARRLGGGGHLRASGCELLGTLDNAKSAVLAEAKAVLDQSGEEA